MTHKLVTRLELHSWTAVILYHEAIRFHVCQLKHKNKLVFSTKRDGNFDLYARKSRFRISIENLTIKSIESVTIRWLWTSISSNVPIRTSMALWFSLYHRPADPGRSTYLLFGISVGIFYFCFGIVDVGMSVSRRAWWIDRWR